MRCWRRSRTCVGRTVTNADGATSVLHGAGGNLEGFSGPSWYGSGRAKERSAGVAVRILSPPAGVVVNPERSIPCPGLTACHSRLPTATCRRLPRPHRSCGVGALQCSSPGGRCEGSSFLRGDGSRAALHGGLHPASSSERTRNPWQGSAPRRGRRGKDRDSVSVESARFNSDGHGGRAQRRRHAPTRAKGPK